jgi:hypothetical protein
MKNENCKIHFPFFIFHFLLQSSPVFIRAYLSPQWSFSRSVS